MTNRPSARLLGLLHAHARIRRDGETMTVIAHAAIRRGDARDVLAYSFGYTGEEARYPAPVAPTLTERVQRSERPELPEPVDTVARTAPSRQPSERIAASASRRS